NSAIAHTISSRRCNAATSTAKLTFDGPTLPRVPRLSDRRIGSRVPMVETDLLAGERKAAEDAPGPDVSLVVTLYNEVDPLADLYRRTVATLDPGPHSFELIFVDDGSTDG